MYSTVSLNEYSLSILISKRPSFGILLGCNCGPWHETVITAGVKGGRLAHSHGGCLRWVSLELKFLHVCARDFSVLVISTSSCQQITATPVFPDSVVPTHAFSFPQFFFNSIHEYMCICLCCHVLLFLFYFSWKILIKTTSCIHIWGCQICSSRGIRHLFFLFLK